jgi:hypothetical protein
VTWRVGRVGGRYGTSPTGAFSPPITLFNGTASRFGPRHGTYGDTNLAGVILE